MVVRTLSKNRLTYRGKRLLIEKKEATSGVFSDGSKQIFEITMRVESLDLPGFGRVPASEVLAWSSDKEKAIAEAKKKVDEKLN